MTHTHQVNNRSCRFDQSMASVVVGRSHLLISRSIVSMQTSFKIESQLSLWGKSDFCYFDTTRRKKTVKLCWFVLQNLPKRGVQDCFSLPGGFCNTSVLPLLLSFSHSYLSRIAPKISPFISVSLSFSLSLPRLYNCSAQTAKILQPTVLKTHTVYINLSKKEECGQYMVCVMRVTCLQRTQRTPE